MPRGPTLPEPYSLAFLFFINATQYPSNKTPQVSFAACNQGMLIDTSGLTSSVSSEVSVDNFFFFLRSFDVMRNEVVARKALGMPSIV